MDIYFDDRYGDLYEDNDNNKLVSYNLENEYGKIKYIFLKRRIEIELPEIERDLFDIVTPYGYGGPIILKSCDKKALVESFEFEFKQYCLKNNIVSEFIVFHPVLGNAVDFKDIYELELDRISIGTNLLYGKETIQREFSKSTRKLIRKILDEDGIKYELIYSPESLEEFKRIYYSTMKRNSASNFYYFNDEYFKKILNNFRNQIVLCNVFYFDKLIASSLNLLSNKNIYVHLSGTDSEYLKFSPAYILKYGLVNWGIAEGYELIHYGGGLTNKDNDSLLVFKQKFGKNTYFDYYYGKKIRNINDYNLLKKTSNKKNNNFFPIYRSKD